MIDYVQSVISSIPAACPCSEDIDDCAWASLRAKVQKLFTQLNLEYQLAFTANRRLQDPALDMELEEFRFRAELIWMNVRGERYHIHERQALLDVPAPHSDVLISLFGINAETIVAELDKVLHKLTRGLADALVAFDKLSSEAADRLAQLNVGAVAGNEDLSRALFDDPEFAANSHKVMGELVGLDLFDVAKITELPKTLLNELAWSPGEEDQFFAPGEFCGWPLRVWPTMTRPFIRIGERFLCFSVFTLFDHIYRVLQRVIFRLAPEYKESWNRRQKSVSEALPFRYLAELLPGARVYRSVYYYWSSGNAPQWCEADGLLIYEDHIFIVEVKAGAFTYTSPATDLPAHISSLKNLLLIPASQGSRFLDYLESAPEVAIADAERNEIGRLRRSAFRHVTICAVTLDPFTELAARAQHLRKVGVDVGLRPVWALSIDDLRVYADLFKNPLSFLHFTEQRMRAVGSELVDLNDEMDHLGLYLAKNNYGQYAAELVSHNGKAKLNFVGYAAVKVDAYYDAIIRGDEAVLPIQKMPERLGEIIGFLPKAKLRRRSEVASFLLDASGDFREELARIIEEQLRTNREVGRSRPLSTYGDMRLTIVVWSEGAPRRTDFALEHTQVVIAANEEAVRPLLELEYASDGVLREVHWQQVSSVGLSSSAIKQVYSAAADLRARRISAAQRGREVRLNDPCPCGRGRKYKRCCGR